jgi:threonine/homoserine/homoserine lactone efflux protein
MIDTSALPIFFAAVAALLVVPGPDFMLIASQSVSRGASYGVACSAGIFLAGILQTLLVAFGLGALMETWPLVATIVRLLGAVYLAYLGLRLLLAWHRQREPQCHNAPKSAPSIPTLLMVGLGNNLLNPKALLFFSVFVPQFVVPEIGSPSTQIMAWGGMLSLLALVYNLTLSLLLSWVRFLHIDVLRLQHHGQGILGLVFLFLAARLSLARTA